MKELLPIKNGAANIYWLLPDIFAPLAACWFEIFIYFCHTVPRFVQSNHTELSWLWEVLNEEGAHTLLQIFRWSFSLIFILSFFCFLPFTVDN